MEEDSLMTDQPANASQFRPAIITYKHLNVGDLIEKLEWMEKDAIIPGVSLDVESYRGYYDHAAIRPGSGAEAGALLRVLAGKLGTVMHGYKGGEYEFNRDCMVFFADYGCTGPMLIGISDDGRFVVAHEGSIW